MPEVQLTAFTPSGLGARVEGQGLGSSDLAYLVARKLPSARLLLLQNVDFSLRDFEDFAARLGTIIPADGVEGARVLAIGNDAAGRSVVRGTGRLPLHSDGLFLGRDVNVVSLYCRHDYQGTLGNDLIGATMVCDQARALEEMPADLRSILDAGLEYITEDSVHFTLEEFTRWTRIPAIQWQGGEPCLRVAMHFRPGEDAAWRVRVPDRDADESVRLLDRLEAHLASPRYTYSHPWRRGDMLVIDNARTLHGRRAIDPANLRTLWRAQARL